MVAKSDIYYIGVLGKTAAVLDVFARTAKRQLTLQEISAACGLNKNTVFRILHTLACHDYVEKDSQAYSLGAALTTLGEVRRRGNDLVTVAGPYLDALRDRFGETANLAVRDGGRVRYIDVRESRSTFRLAERIGGRDYLHSTAIGKVHLAWLPYEDVRRLMKDEGMPRQTPRTLTTLAALKKELAEVRKRGYATDDEEAVSGAFCVGVPIRDRKGRVVASLSLSGPKARLGGSHVAVVSKALSEAAAAIGSRLE